MLRYDEKHHDHFFGKATNATTERFTREYCTSDIARSPPTLHPLFLKREMVHAFCQ